MREKRQRNKHQQPFIEPKIVTKYLQKYLYYIDSVDYKYEEYCFIAWKLSDDNKLSWRTQAKFTGTDITNAIKFVNKQLKTKIPKPSVMRHLYCTHQYQKWYNSGPKPPKITSRGRQKTM